MPLQIVRNDITKMKVDAIIIALVAIAGIAVWTYFGRAAAKKVAGATEALSSSEGSSAKSAAESIGEDSIKKLGE